MTHDVPAGSDVQVNSPFLTWKRRVNEAALECCFDRKKIADWLQVSPSLLRGFARCLFISHLPH